MKFYGFVVFTVLLHGLGGAAEVQPSSANDAPCPIEAALALATHSISSGQDTVEVLKNTVTILSALKGGDRIDSALMELMSATQEAIEYGGDVQCTSSNEGECKTISGYPLNQNNDYCI